MSIPHAVKLLATVAIVTAHVIKFFVFMLCFGFYVYLIFLSFVGHFALNWVQIYKFF